MTAEGSADALSLTATRLLWAGGQERAAGRVSVRLRRDGDATFCDVTAEMDQPIKAVTTVVRGVPRGKLSSSGGEAPGEKRILPVRLLAAAPAGGAEEIDVWRPESEPLIALARGLAGILVVLGARF